MNLPGLIFVLPSLWGIRLTGNRIYCYAVSKVKNAAIHCLNSLIPYTRNLSKITDRLQERKRKSDTVAVTYKGKASSRLQLLQGWIAGR